jgi:hypothetical protein
VPNEQRADLRARCGRKEYLIEAKHKDENGKWLDSVERMQARDSDSISRRIVPWRAIARVIEDGRDQLVATPSSPEAFRLLWMVSRHEDDEFVMECIKCRLFGVETVSVMEAQFATKPCFYYSYSDFRRCPEIDGAVLSIRKGSKLCVNSFSSRQEDFRTSRLYKMFEQMGSLCDPEVLEERGAAYIIGRDFTAKPTGREQWAYLRKKYGVRTTVMQRSRFDARIALALPEFPDASSH